MIGGHASDGIRGRSHEIYRVRNPASWGKHRGVERQRKAVRTLTRAEHVGHAGHTSPPQSTPVSLPFLILSKQDGQAGQLPPQSRPVSSPFCFPARRDQKHASFKVRCGRRFWRVWRSRLGMVRRRCGCIMRLQPSFTDQKHGQLQSALNEGRLGHWHVPSEHVGHAGHEPPQSAFSSSPFCFPARRNPKDTRRSK